eukprot:4026086-Prymnesium_polylepis.1
MKSHEYESGVRFFITMLALNVGFFRVTQYGSNVNCEMLAYYFYYRTSLMIATWGSYFVQDTLALGSGVNQYYELRRKRGTQRVEARPTGKQRGKAKAEASQLMREFLGPLVLRF